jgi:hypothetical protein
MLKANKTYLLLLLIFTFSFVYRMLLMLWDGFPSGADIGLHNSVIYSITASGNTDFLYNLYHIGGGISLTFPGYHIFTAGVMMLTGLPEYLAHAAVVSLFSSLIVICAFLITRRIWSTPAAYIAAFLAAISRFDIEMLLWAGYPNVITLMLIPLTFYLYLQKDRFSTVPFLATASLLAGSIFLTHSLSAAIFAAITVLTALAVFIKPEMLGTTRKTGLYWLLSIVLGAVLFAPFLAQAVPAYIKENSTLAALFGYSANIDVAASEAIKSATLSTRVLPLELVLPLFGALAGFLVFSKKYYGKSVTLPTFLLSMWLFVPLILTLGYVVGFAIDFNRFLYFLILPLIIFIAVLIEHGSSFFAQAIDKKYNPVTGRPQKIGNLRITRFIASLSAKKLYSIFVLFFLLFSFLALPIFMGPIYRTGEAIQGFYQTMNDEGWEAIQWAKTNTAPDAVFVSDALYGWWLSGFAQRRTYSAVDPQYLSINEEFNKTLFARNLLDTDYVIDSNSTLIPQVRDDGGYIARHNPQILVKQNWTYYPSSFFNFNSNATSIRYHIDDNPAQIVMLDQLAVKEMQIENDTQHATITVTRGNDDFDYTISTTVTQGIRFVNVTSTLTSLRPGIAFDWVDIRVETKPIQIHYTSSATMGFVDIGTKAFGQLIFTTIPASKIPGLSTVQLTYSLEGKAQGQIQMLATAYSESNNEQYYSSQANMDAYFSPIMTENLESALEPIQDNVHLNVFDYRSELQTWNVSYIACRSTEPAGAEIDPKFRRDPLFSLVFINEEVAIFKVNGNLNQG